MHQNAKDITGQRFGRLVVVGPTENRERRSVVWKCDCDCGQVAMSIATHLRNGKTQSCGCLAREVLADRNRKRTKAEEDRRESSTSYWPWRSMRQRCRDPKSKAYRYYGGRGITVCQRWDESFENFVEDMGPRPSLQHSIDRIDVNGNYEPNNCRWATIGEQSVNRRNTVRITAFGATKCLTEWSEETGVNRATIRARLRKGWDPELAITTAPRCGSCEPLEYR